jgi:hypothetical protein
MELIWILAILVVAVVAAVGWVVWRISADRGDSPTTASAPAAPRRIIKPTWGKTVVVPDPTKACEAVMKISGESFSNDAAPRLPLPSCTSSSCKCYFVPARERRFRTERRSGMDRRTGLRYEPGEAGDRRSGKDRRHGKHYDWDETI